MYLDNAATSQKPEVVLQAMEQFYKEYNANVHRGIYHSSEKATLQYEEARRKVAEFINAKQEEIVFTSGTTAGLNLLAYCLTENLQKDDEILVTEMEHHSNFVPWQQLAKRKGLVFRVAPITAEGQLDMKQFQKLLSKKTKIVSITAVSNVLGTINPMQEVVQLAHGAGAVCIVDAAQSIPHFPTNVKELDCDFLVFSGHKVYGPTGVGVLYGKKELLEKMEPFLFGGGMIREVQLDVTTWNDVPWKFEGGTPNIAGVIGLGAAIDYLQAKDLKKIERQEKKLTHSALQELRKVPGVTVYGPEERGPVIAFSMEGIPPHDLATLLDREKIAVRAGHHCAMPLAKKLGLAGTVRASFALYNTIEEVEALIAAIKKAQEVFHR